MLSTQYYPEAWDRWEKRDPTAVGLNASALDEAVQFAIAHETPWPLDLRVVIEQGWSEETKNEPIKGALGPLKDRGGPNGLIFRHGYCVAEWGDTRRVDMTFSISKSYLSIMAGLALDDGLIPDVHDRIGAYVHDGHFDSAQNHPITWHHLLQQTSEWEGTLWDKPDWGDRFSGEKCEKSAPGSYWEYNDVRVNVLALALLHVWRRPLPQILKTRIMDDLGASTTWRWHGYDNSWITLDGLQMQSVSGGGHWGGGVWINSWDHALFGYLFLRRGYWQGRQLVSERWIAMMTTPCPQNIEYGYMWWLNTKRQLVPTAPESSFFALGAGRNLIWIDPEHDLLAVVRWIDPDSAPEFVEKVLAAVTG